MVCFETIARKLSYQPDDIYESNELIKLFVMNKYFLIN